MKNKKIMGIIGAVFLAIAFFAFGLPSIIAQIFGLPTILVYISPIIIAVAGAVMFWYGFLKK